MAGPSPMPPPAPAQPRRLAPRGAVARPGGPKGRPWPGPGGPGLVALVGPSPCAALSWLYRAGPPFAYPTTSHGPRGPRRAACASRAGPSPGPGGHGPPRRPLWWPWWPCGGPGPMAGPRSPARAGAGPPWPGPAWGQRRPGRRPPGAGPCGAVEIATKSMWNPAARLGWPGWWLGSGSPSPACGRGGVAQPWRVCHPADTCPAGHTCLGLAAVWRPGDTPCLRSETVAAGTHPRPPGHPPVGRRPPGRSTTTPPGRSTPTPGRSTSGRPGRARGPPGWPAAAAPP